MENDEPVTPPITDPPTPPTPPAVPPAPAPEPPPSGGQGDNTAISALTQIVNSAVQTITAIGEKVDGLGRPDTKPVKRPWTHWGSK